MRTRSLRPFLSRLLLAAFGILAGVGAVAAQERFANLSPALAPRHLADGRATSAPIGFVRFCADAPQECLGVGVPARSITLDARRAAELERINRAVNDAVEPVTDLDHFGETELWTYPRDGQGDCEDYVLEKRARLIDLGWPSSVLLITVVRDHVGDGHAVLTVITDKGDLVLDNQETAILSWKETGYRFVKRQSQMNPADWVSLGETRVPPIVVGSGH